MCCKIFWKKFVPFALTLLLSLLAVEYYVAFIKQEFEIKQDNQRASRTIAIFNSKISNFKHNKCIEFRGDNLYRKKLISDIEEIENLLKKSDIASHKKAEFYLKESKKIENKYAQRRNIEARLAALKKWNGTDKLLYIENCIQYSE